MGMAGGAYQGDKERAQLALQAAQVANQRRMQEQQLAMQERRLQEDARRADMADERANRQLDIQEQNNQLRFEQQNATLQERMRQNDMIDSSRSRGLDIREQLAAARQQAADARLAKLAGQNNMLGQFQQVCDVEQKQVKAKQAQGQSTMASMMKMGLMKGGTVPMAALNFANRQFGFDGKNQAIGAAGFMENGNFFIDFLQKDQNSGQIVRNTQTFNFEDMGRVMYSQAGIFDNADRQQWREGMAKRGYSTQEIDKASGLNATMLERLDDAGRQRLEAGFADPSQDGDWKAQYTRRKQEIDLQLAERKLAKTLGQNGLTSAQKYALYHFNEFATPTAHEATAEDVKAGLAKKIGEQVWTQTSPDQAFQKAVEFYNKNSQNADPAITPDPGNGGGEPEVIKNPIADSAANGIDAVASGDNEVSTDRPYVSQSPVVNDGTGEEDDADDRLPDGGLQGEFDFGGMEGTDAPETPAKGDNGSPQRPADQEVPDETPTEGDSSRKDNIPNGEEDATSEIDEDGVSVHNPFAKWVKRSKKNRR